jgi:hypothetical protein
MSDMKMADKIVNQIIEEALFGKLFEGKDRPALFDKINVKKKLEYLETEKDIEVFAVTFDAKREVIKIITRKWVHKFLDFNVKPSGLERFDLSYKAVSDKIMGVE